MVNAQLPIEEKKRLADVVIDNSGSITETERQVDHLWKWLASKVDPPSTKGASL